MQKKSKVEIVKEDMNLYEEKRFSTKELIMIILGFLPSGIIILIFIAVLIGICINKIEFQTKDIYKILSGTIQMDIIATAVTIWVGLNIYNLITKEDLDNEIKKILNKRMEGTKEENEQILYNQINKSEFIELLEKTRYKYAISDFLICEINKSNENDFFGLSYEDALHIEHQIILCIQNYESNNWDTSWNYASKLLEHIKNKIIKENKESKYTYISLIYIYDRLGDAYFYLNANRGRGNKETNLEQLKLAIDCYNKEVTYLVNAYPSSDENRKVKAYIVNTIGYTYRLCVFEMKIDSTSRDWYDTNKESIKYGEKSLNYAIYKGRYIRNVGLGYEYLYVNFDRILDMSKKLRIENDIYTDMLNLLIQSKYLSEINTNYGNAKKYVNELLSSNSFCTCKEKEKIKEIIKELTMYYYKESLKLDKSDYKGYNNIGGFYLRILDDEFGITSQRQNTIDELLSITINDREEKLEQVLEAEQYLILSREISGTFEDCRFNLAKAKMYEYYFRKTGKERVKEEALEEVKRVLIMNKNHIGARCVLRNCYEAFGELQKAIEENNKLEKKKDAKEICVLYDKKMSEKI